MTKWAIKNVITNRGNVLAKEVQLRRTDDEVIWAL